MSANPIDKNATPKTTGNLEELFRHHLGEEAAVPTRPMLWDQIDNSLLLHQNETYRRRLTVTRWVAAASLLLASLAGTGWWSLRDPGLAQPTVATNGQTAPDAATTTNAITAQGSQRNSAGGKMNETGTAMVDVPAPTGQNLPATGAVGAVADRNTGFGAERLGQELGQGRAIAGQVPTQRASLGRLATTSRAGTAGAAGNATAPGVAFAAPVTSAVGTAGATGSVGALPMATATDNGGLVARTTPAEGTPQAGLSGITQSAGQMPGAGHTAAGTVLTAASAETTLTAAKTRTTAGASGLTLAATSGSTPAGTIAGGTSVAAVGMGGAPAAGPAAGPMSLLAAHPAALSLTDPAALPNGLTALALPADAEPVLPAAVPHRWKYSTSYTAGIFNPNINFSRAGTSPDCDYNPALGPNSPAQTEAAATQYRQYLRPGLSQRLALQAARHLTGKWSLSTGVELSQATASSASASAFVGEQLLDLGQTSSGELQTTNFRYRLASLPLELRYANPVKRGWSVYGHLGGVVSALLGVRSDVVGNPEATRTYSIMSAGTPYRRLLSSLRGGAGMQFRPNTGHWTLGVGPVAEIGLVSLNAHPTQSYFAQSHAYGFGLEASLEFGR